MTTPVHQILGEERVQKDAKDVLARPEMQQYPSYAYKPEEQKFITDWWAEFLLMWQAKAAAQEILGGRNLQAFWDESVRDYAVITDSPEDPNDPVQQYVSSVSRDKADVFIGNLVSQLLYPSVRAFNGEKEIDKVLSRVSRSLLEWAHMNDGCPSENGHAKTVRYLHKMVVEGTVHIQDDVSKEYGLNSSLVPNEEIFIPNFWEPDLQKQSHLIRAQLNVTWENAERVYGHLENFKYVQPAFTDFWFIQRPELKQVFDGIVRAKRVQVMHVWKGLTHAQLKAEKDAGRLPAKAKRAKYYNVVINDIPMYPVDNLSPYKDGMFPINKGIFAHMAKPEYYWGNSLPNKIRYDKRWLDAWKTLIRYKGKLNMLPPMVSLNGNFVDEEILLPSKITPITEELQLRRIEGVADPVSQADVMLLNMAEAEIDRGSVAPSMAGQMPTKRMTKAESQIADANAKKLLDAFLLQAVFLAQSRAFGILRRLFQFLPRGDFKKIVVPEQKLADGTRGNLEIVFERIPPMTEDEYAMKSEELLKAEIKNRRAKNPKDSVTIDPKYLEEVNFYLIHDAASGLEDKDALKKAEFNKNLQLYLSRPDLFNAKEVARTFVRMNDDPDELLIDSEPLMPGPENPLSAFAEAAPGASFGKTPQQQGGIVPGGLQSVEAF